MRRNSQEQARRCRGAIDEKLPYDEATAVQTTSRQGTGVSMRLHHNPQVALLLHLPLYFFVIFGKKLFFTSTQLWHPRINFLSGDAKKLRFSRVILNSSRGKAKRAQEIHASTNSMMPPQFILCSAEISSSHSRVPHTVDTHFSLLATSHLPCTRNSNHAGRQLYPSSRYCCAVARYAVTSFHFRHLSVSTFTTPFTTNFLVLVANHTQLHYSIHHKFSCARRQPYSTRRNKVVDKYNYLVEPAESRSCSSCTRYKIFDYAQPQRRLSSTPQLYHQFSELLTSFDSQPSTHLDV